MSSKLSLEQQVMLLKKELEIEKNLNDRLMAQIQSYQTLLAHYEELNLIHAVEHTSSEDNHCGFQFTDKAKVN